MYKEIYDFLRIFYENERNLQNYVSVNSIFLILIKEAILTDEEL